MSKKDISEFGGLLNKFVSKKVSHGLTCNSIILTSRDSETPDRKSYIWIDPPWKLYCGDDEIISSQSYPDNLPNREAEELWFSEFPASGEMDFVSWASDELGDIWFEFSDNYVLLAYNSGSDLRDEQWYDDWYVRI